MSHAGDHDWSTSKLCTIVVDGRRCYARQPSPRDFMVEDKWDRRDLVGVRWMLLTPGMQDTLRTATDEQLLDYAVGELGASSEAFARRVREAELGAWIPFKDGIAVRLGPMIDHDDDDDPE